MDGEAFRPRAKKIAALSFFPTGEVTGEYGHLEMEHQGDLQGLIGYVGALTSDGALQTEG